MRTVAFHTLGCKVNQYDSEAMLELFEQAGYTAVDFSEKADVYVVNTCTVTGTGDKKSLQAVRRAQRLNPAAEVVIAGCLAQRDGEKLLDTGARLVLGNAKRGQVVQLLEEAVEKGQRVAAVTDILRVPYEPLFISRHEGHTRAVLKIQEGCDRYCTYCIIPYVRGGIRSRKPADIAAEAARLAQAGFTELVLTGIHLTSYGRDLGDATLLDAIRACDQPGVQRIRLGSLEPRIITEEFAGRLAAIPQLCPHFHLSLQSGCNETLKRMNRHYTAEEYYEKVQILRNYFEHPAITTDVIVGFPGETAEEFAVTKTFLEKVHFFEMHIFKYSRRKGTVADKLPGQLTDAQKTERSGQLLALEKEQSREFRAHYLGQEVEVLIEEQKEIGGKVYWLGHTDTYVKAAFAADSAECMDYSNRLVHGRAVSFLSDEVLEISLNF